MTADVFAAVAGHRATTARLYVPNVGPWFGDFDLDEGSDLVGKVDVTFGALKLSGTVAAGASGTYVLTSRVRVVGGGGGWAKVLGPKGYHNDAGVNARTVAEDAAREAGERLGTFSPAGSGKLGVDYVRRAGAASRALEDAAGGVPWWVAYDGLTHVLARSAVALDTAAYELLSFDPRTRLALVAVDDPSKIPIGSILSDRLVEPQTVRELQFSMTEGAVRALAWCGGGDVTPSRLVGQLTAIVDRILARKLYGKYRYRVVSMAVDGRANLQSVIQGAGLPDILPAMVRPGLAGVWADLSLGCEVLVEFIAGAASDPIVTAFPGRGQPGFVPTKITIGASSPGAAPPAARQGDAVKVLIPPGVFTGTIGGAPASGVVSWVNPYALGTVTGGSGKVGVGS